MDIKTKYREEKDIDCYVQQWQKEKPSYTDEYVKWLEQQLILSDVSSMFSAEDMTEAFIDGKDYGMGNSDCTFNIENYR